MPFFSYADIAQSVECILGKDEVTSSNLVISSMKTLDRSIRRFSYLYAENRDFLSKNVDGNARFPYCQTVFAMVKYLRGDVARVSK